MTYRVEIVFLVLEEILDSFVGHHLLVKDVSTRLRALHHLDNLGVRTSVGLSFLQRCDCFLCHGFLGLLDFFMDGHSLQDGVVFLQLQAFRVILTVLGRDVARCPGKAALFHLGAFKYDLHAVAFCFFSCHSLVCVKRLL